MTYKNNYQRKQAVWREKWMKKVEERQKIQNAFPDLRRALIDAFKPVLSAANLIIEKMSDPKFVEKLKRLQEKGNE